MANIGVVVVVVVVQRIIMEVYISLVITVAAGALTATEIIVNHLYNTAGQNQATHTHKHNYH